MTIRMNILDSARIKLTASYVFILLLIILLFSFVLYRGAVGELQRSLRTQALRFVPRYDRLVPMSIVNEPDEEVFEAARTRLLIQLIGIDTAIFAFSTAASYILAGRTLKPIQDAMDKQKQFVSDASHELRTPLTAMRTEIEVMLREKKIETADARKILESNLEEIDKMRALSDYLLKLTSLDTADHALKLEHVNLTAILQTAVKHTDHLAQEKKITVDSSALNVTQSVIGNKVSLIELFTILLDNAIKYSHEQGSIEIVLHTSKKHVQVDVVDHGIGIRASELPYIFNRFYRADSSRNKKKVDGFGLGLAIAKTIVVQNAGRISVASEVNTGTVFKVTLNS